MSARVAVENAWADRGAVPVLRGVHLSVAAGELVAVLGPNGAGKSSLLLALSGVLPLRRGHLLIDGIRADHLAPERRARLGIAHIAQGRRLFPDLTVRENLALAAFAGHVDVPAAAALFAPVERLLDTPAGLLSGGEQQLVAVARGLAARPRVVFADEPTSALAAGARRQVLDELRRRADAGAAVLVVEQEVEAVLRVADRSVTLRAGRVEGEGLTPPA